MRIVVIGAGIIGASIAEALARRGAEVLVLDMRGPGQGASHASAGLLAPYTEAQGENPLLLMGVRSLALFDDFIARIREHSGMTIEYARTGTFEVAQTEDDVARLLAMQAWMEMNEIWNHWMEGDAACSFEPALSPGILGGLFIDKHGFVGVPGLISALIKSAESAGAKVEKLVQAIEVLPGSDGVRVRAEGYGYEAEHSSDFVVVSAGSWSASVRVEGVQALPVRPVRGQLLHLDWRGEPAPRRPVWSHGCYTVPWSDGTVLVGATVEEVGFDESTTDSAREMLRSAAASVLPAAKRATLIEARAGLRPATLDGLPFIGTAAGAPRVMFATGHYRNGVLLAPLTAAMVEAAILDGRTDAMMARTSPNRLASGGGGGR